MDLGKCNCTDVGALGKCWKFFEKFPFNHNWKDHDYFKIRNTNSSYKGLRFLMKFKSPDITFIDDNCLVIRHHLTGRDYYTDFNFSRYENLSFHDKLLKLEEDVSKIIDLG